jgi:putative membrane protein
MPFTVKAHGTQNRPEPLSPPRISASEKDQEVIMKHMQLMGTAAVALLLSVSAASAQSMQRNDQPAPGSKSEAMSATKDKLGHAVGVISAEMTTTTKGFLGAASMSDMYEVQAGKIAATRSKNAQVKNFANTMVTAHTKTTDEAKAIVASEKIAFTPPTALDNRHQMMINNLNGASDTDFDKRYISQQVDAHNEALILMRGYHDSGDNKALKDFAGKTENAVKMHLSMAEKLKKTLDAKAEK